MRAFLAAALLSTLALSGLPASAQTSRAERQVQDINRAQQLQQRQVGQQQQNQFEINQLRGDIQRSQQFPSVTGPGAGRGCPPGSIGC